MASGKSNWLSDALVNYVLRWVVPTLPASLYLALYTVAPTVSGGGTEVSTSGAYVDLGGPGIFALSASSATPTSFTSVNLKTTAGWTNGNAVYEVRLHTSDGTKAATLGSAVIITTP